MKRDWEQITGALREPAPVPEGLAERAYQKAVCGNASAPATPAQGGFFGLTFRAALAAGLAAAALVVVLQVRGAAPPTAMANPVAMTWSMDVAGFEERDPSALIRVEEEQP